MKRVYCDECGNTGQNLLDQADPIFVVAACSFDANQEQEVNTLLQEFKGPELKFSRLRKTPGGQRAVLAFLNSACVTSETAAAVVFHKPFMVVTKYCDLVLEPSMRKFGIDFYARGLNIATANLLTTIMPVVLNPKTWSDFLALFTRVVRERTTILFHQWRKSAELIYSHVEYAEPGLASYFAPIISMDNADEFLGLLTGDELDPLIPAYHALAGIWGKSLGGRYELFADESKVLAKERDRLLALADPSLKPVRVGYDRRKIEFPLKVADIITVDSITQRQIQFADILAGAIANAAKARVKAPLKTGTFERNVFEACFAKGVIFDSVWPNHEVDPTALGTDIKPGLSDINASIYTAMVYQGDPSTKKDNS